MLSRKDRYSNVLAWFAENMHNAKSELNFRNPYELLVAVMLSAQCTDKRVNQVTPALFERYPDIYSLANGTEEDILEYIKSVSYPNAKALHLLQMAKIVVEKCDGVIPSTMEALTTLPGVGRKTANVIRGNIFHEPSIVVDTHVKRISKKLGLSKSDDPVKAEQELMKVLPKDHWILYNIQLITFGREICKAPNPKCEECFMTHLCPDYKKRMKAGRGGVKAGKREQ